MYTDAFVSKYQINTVVHEQICKCFMSNTFRRRRWTSQWQCRTQLPASALSSARGRGPIRPIANILTETYRSITCQAMWLVNFNRCSHLVDEITPFVQSRCERLSVRNGWEAEPLWAALRTEWVKECGLTTLETQRLRGDQIEMFKILKGYEVIDSNIFFEIKEGKITTSLWWKNKVDWMLESFHFPRGPSMYRINYQQSVYMLVV